MQFFGTPCSKTNTRGTIDIRLSEDKTGCNGSNYINNKNYCSYLHNLQLSTKTQQVLLDTTGTILLAGTTDIQLSVETQLVQIISNTQYGLYKY